MAHLVKSCVICGSHDITLRWATEHHVTITCRACRRIVAIEFDPPDEPGLRGRIDLLFDPHGNAAAADD